MKDAVEVGFDDPSEFGEVALIDFAQMIYAGVVDQHVYTTEAVDRSLDERLAYSVIGYVGFAGFDCAVQFARQAHSV